MTAHTPLEPLGWNSHFRGAAETAISENEALRHSQPGRIGRVDRGACVVLTAAGPVTATSNSLVSQDASSPVTGDWVLLSQEAGLGWVIDSILPRRSQLVRRDPAVDVSEQTIVSNVDVVGIVHGLDRELQLAQLERLLVLAVNGGARPAIVLNKADLVSAAEQASLLRQVRAIAPRVEVGATSVLPEALDLAFLQAQIAVGETLALIGVSGVGKSSLAKALLAGHGGDLQTPQGQQGSTLPSPSQPDPIKVAEPTASPTAEPGAATAARGQHTTVARDLRLLSNGGVIIDTPGLRAVGLWAADAALDEVFSDIAELAESCKFRDCSHRQEPACAVTDAVAAGVLAEDRLARYLRLCAELSELAQAREVSQRKAKRGRHRQKVDKKVRRQRGS